MISHVAEPNIAQAMPEAPQTAAPARRVLFLDHTATLGGGEIALLHLVQALDPRLYTPVVILFADGPLVERLQNAGVETHVLPLAPCIARSNKDALGAASLLRVRDGLTVLAYTFRLAGLIRKQRAALVHTNSLKSDIIGGIAARLARLPILWHVRDRIAPDYLPAPVVRIFRRLCRALPDYVVVNSQATLATLTPHTNCRVVYDGVPVSLLHYSDNTPEVAHAPSRPVIGLVGRISPWKGQHIFLQAAAHVHHHYPQARFLIIGAALFQEQDYEAEMRALATSLGLDECVEFMGFRQDVPELIAGLDVLVHASTSGEPFGQVIVEGMAAGKPVVATNGGGVPEIIQNGQTGLLVTMGDAGMMAAAILSLLSNPGAARRMGQMGHRRVREHFTLAHTARNIEAVYQDLL